MRRNAAGDFGGELISVRDNEALENRMSERCSQPLTILQRLARADRSAVQDCLEAYGAVIWALAKKYTRSSKEAEIITEQTFLEIWKCAVHFDPNKCSENKFIAFLVLRQQMRQLRKSKSMKAAK
jgi:RNA polymerase sigma-70 factor (ECF subfamily)